MTVSCLLAFQPTLGILHTLKCNLASPPHWSYFKRQLIQSFATCLTSAHIRIDILIGAPTKEIHDQTLQMVKARLSAHHFQLNSRKCQVGLPEVKFLGFLLSDGKLLPNPELMAALAQLPRPANKEQLRSLLGSLRHYGCFCPNFSAIAQPLYHLLKKDVRWVWTHTHSRAVSTLTSKIYMGSLVCYDLSKPLFVTCDASRRGLGFVLSHDPEQNKIVWTGSRVLSPAESNYSNIEREALSIVEAVKYFHRFLAGRHFTIRSDHLPLRYIFNSTKNSDRISCRLQRWTITLKAYDYSIECIEGEEMLLADTFSRLPLRQNQSSVPEVDMLQINALQEFTEGTSLLRDIANTSDCDFDRLKRYITEGRPYFTTITLNGSALNWLSEDVYNDIFKD